MLLQFIPSANCFLLYSVKLLGIAFQSSHVTVLVDYITSVTTRTEAAMLPAGKCCKRNVRRTSAPPPSWGPRPSPTFRVPTIRHSVLVDCESFHLQVICLDEATASIDTDTDALIQHTINQEFSTSTIIIIAHRLHTIIDADRVLVMDHGEAAEYGSPADLLANPDGVFSSELANHAAPHPPPPLWLSRYCWVFSSFLVFS